MVEDRNILISGASGLIGPTVVRAIEARSMHAVRLVRGPVEPGEQAIFWQPAAETDPDKTKPLDLSGFGVFDGAIHLSGANVAAHRWTPAYKRVILESRVRSTEALCNILTSMERPPSVLVSASAIGLYGGRGDEIIDESSPPGTGFLAETCKAWEAATRRAEEAGIRVVNIRIGIVLTPAGGALGKLLPLFRAGLGGRLGDGRQWMSWISLPDVVAAILHAIDDPSLRGPVNFTSPNPVTNREFTAILGRVLHRPAMLAVPGFVLRLAAGEMADEALLAGCRALPRKLLESGFSFSDTDLEPALRKLLA